MSYTWCVGWCGMSQMYVDGYSTQSASSWSGLCSMVSGCRADSMLRASVASTPAAASGVSPITTTFPGTVYQLGNLLASGNLTLQTTIAMTYGGYSLALASVAVFAAIVIAVLVYLGPAAHNVQMRAGEDVSA